MGVNSGGSGSTVSFSDLQSAYGGSHPISISEYYRGGSLVPSTSTSTQKSAASASGNSTNTTGSITATVNSSTTATGSLSGFSTKQMTSRGQTVSWAVTNNTASLVFGTRHPDKDGGSSYAEWRYQVSGSGSVEGDSNDNTGNGGFIYDGWFQGPAYQSNDQSPWPAYKKRQNVSSGQTVTLTMEGGQRQQLDINYRGNVTVYNHTLRNNSGVTVNLTSSPWGNDSSFTNGETKTDNNNSSASWSWSHPAVTTTVNSNTNVPASGQINMNTFNSPGNFAP